MLMGSPAVLVSATLGVFAPCVLLAAGLPGSAGFAAAVVVLFFEDRLPEGAPSTERSLEACAFSSALA